MKSLIKKNFPWQKRLCIFVLKTEFVMWQKQVSWNYTKLWHKGDQCTEQKDYFWGIWGIILIATLLLI